MIKIIRFDGKIGRNYIAFVDDRDYDLVLSKGPWYLYRRRAPTYYACTGDTETPIWMHRLILPAPKGLYTSHIDGNGLNNTRDNLKILTSLENGQYQRMHSNNTSGVQGVKRYLYREGWWHAEITVYGKRKYLGIFSTFEAAVEARKKAEREYRG